MYEYVNKQGLMYDFQSGFRKTHSTDSCLLYLTDFIRKEIDEGNQCGMVLLELQKAFDTVNHLSPNLQTGGTGVKQYPSRLGRLEAGFFFMWMTTLLVSHKSKTRLESILRTELT